jgi:hypothetical protein
MLRKSMIPFLQVVFLLSTLQLATAGAHGHDEAPDSDMRGVAKHLPNVETGDSLNADKEALNYFHLAENTTWIYGHILVMTICWTIILPLCKFYLKAVNPLEFAR